MLTEKKNCRTALSKLKLYNLMCCGSENVHIDVEKEDAKGCENSVINKSEKINLFSSLKKNVYVYDCTPL